MFKEIKECLNEKKLKHDAYESEDNIIKMGITANDLIIENLLKIPIGILYEMINWTFNSHGNIRYSDYSMYSFKER